MATKKRKSKKKGKRKAKANKPLVAKRRRLAAGSATKRKPAKPKKPKAAPKPACVIIAAKTRSASIVYFDGAGWEARRGAAAKLLRSVAGKLVPALRRSFSRQISAIGIFSERESLEAIYQAFDGKKR